MSGAPSTMSAEDFANLSDDEIMNMTSAPEITQVDAPDDAGSDDDGIAATGDAEGAQGEAEKSVDPVTDDKGKAADDPDEQADAGAEGDAGSDDDPDLAKSKADLAKAPVNKGPADKTAKDGEKAKEPALDTAKPDTAAPVVIDYKASYEKIMAPFKANGKEVKLENPDDVIRLMQMGANYTKKLQALQPRLQMLKMLENNNLLDEGKLSYLIDLDKKNPQAIQKLLKDSGVDPMDIDTTAEPSYQPGNHKVSDAEFNFSSTLEEVASDPAGKDLILTINQTWDKSSKDELWKDPNILRVLTEQKQNGIYSKITTELERQRMLGTLGTEPFLKAYYRIGNSMQQSGLLGTSAPAQQEQRQVVETRTVAKSTVTNGDKARAASPTRTAPKQVVADFNPLSMSDEEFEKSGELAKRL